MFKYITIFVSLFFLAAPNVNGNEVSAVTIDKSSSQKIDIVVRPVNYDNILGEEVNFFAPETIFSNILDLPWDAFGKFFNVSL